MHLNYILDDKGNPIPCQDLSEWGRWMITPGNKILKHTRLKNPAAEKGSLNDEGEVLVSTVFLGIDHGWRSPVPVLWETMIFGHPDFTDYQERYATREAAMEGHAKAVHLVCGKTEPGVDNGP